MTTELNTNMIKRARELADLANEVTGTEHHHAGLLTVSTDVENSHGTLYLRWTACLGSFCSEGLNKTLEEALDSVERQIRKAGS